MTASRDQAPGVLGIQYLRGFAAIIVLIFHVSETYGLGFRVGAAGVDIFFVISGFIMWITTAGKPVTPSAFMRRRAARVVPLYWLVTILTAAAATAKPAFFFHHDASARNILGSLVFLPAISSGELRPVVIQGWTLCYEMLFYALFALSLNLDKRYRLAVILPTLSGLVALHLFAPPGYGAAFTSPLLLEFAAGVAIGAAWHRGISVHPLIAWSMFAAGLACLGVENFALAQLPRVIGWGIPAAMIVAGIAFAELRNGLPEIRPLHFFGDASYSIYLWHVLAGALVTAFLLRTGAPAPAMPVAVASISFVLTLIAYKLAEKPLNNLFKTRRRETITGEHLRPSPESS